ncbi:MAG: hypothetical protein P1P85_02600 [Patescibacteria group bacterium]|nr:hypothetical protein [Patescibacteria group bacterium]
MKTNKSSKALLFLFFIVLFLTTTNQVNAQWVTPSSYGLIPDINVGIMGLTNWFLGFTGLFSTLMLIWGGLNYVASSGDQQKAELSKKIIYYAFIGLFISGLSYAIIKVLTTVIFN